MQYFLLQLDASFMAALPDDIRTEIKFAYGRDAAIKPPAASAAFSPEKSLHPLLRPEVHFAAF